MRETLSYSCVYSNLIWLREAWFVERFVQYREVGIKAFAI